MFKQGKIIRKFRARNGEEVILRYPKMGDVDGILNVTNSLVAEPDIKIIFTKKSTKKKEYEWLKSEIRNMKMKRSVFLLAEHNRRIIGSGGINKSGGVKIHTAYFGIGVLKYYRNLGIGTEMMKAIFEEAKKIGVKIVRLEVFANNMHAIKTYKNFGFKTFGKLPNGLYKNKKFIDEIYMYKNI